MLSFLRKFVLPILLSELLVYFFASGVDLQARWFGVLVGLAAGLILWLIRRHAWGFALLTGYLSGLIFDFLYLAFYGTVMHCFLLILLGGLAAYLVKNWVKSPFRRVYQITALVVLVVTWYLTCPNLLEEPRELPEGIYVYANDVVYDKKEVNFVSSRLGIAVHTGMCFVTRDPVGFNRERRKAGLQPLYFQKIGFGYWINDLNLEVKDHDDRANYASRTKLDDKSFAFDKEHMKYYLTGRSVNDRLKPSIRFVPLNVPNPREAWNRIDEFRMTINAQYPDGFIYSPVPYEGHFVRLYNCNTITVGIADEFLDRGNEAARLTNLPLNLGGQGVNDGRHLMKDYRTPDFQSRINQERAFWKSEPKNKQFWLHRILFRMYPEDKNP